MTWFTEKRNRPLAGGAIAVLLVAAVLLAALVARSGGEDVVVAKVGGSRVITLAEIEEQFQRQQVPAEAKPDSIKNLLLEALIQKELLVLEAKERGFFDAQVDSMAAAYGDNLLRDKVRDSEARVDTTVTEEEITEEMVRSEEEIRMRHIIHWSRASIDSARSRIDAGESFATVATAMSLDYQTAPDGGLLSWLSDRQLITEFRRALDPHTIGKVVGPFESPFGWHLAVIDSLRPREGGDPMSRESVKADLLAARQSDRRNAVFAEYRRAHNLELDDAALAATLAEAEAAFVASQADSVLRTAPIRDRWIPREPERALATYNEGQVRVADYRDYLAAGGMQNLSRRVNQFGIRADVREMFYLWVRLDEARKRGFDRDPEWKRKVALKREELAVDRLYAQMTADIRFAEADLRTYHEQHPDEFKQAEALRYAFFIVDDPSVAQWLVGEMETIARVAFDSTITDVERQRASTMFDSLEVEVEKTGHLLQAMRDSGRRDVDPASKVVQAARSMKPGDVGHVLEAGGMHVIFIMIEHSPEKAMPFDMARMRVDRTLATMESEKRLKAMLTDLEGKYGVERHPERLESSQG